MQIATWNLDRRLDSDGRALLMSVSADVLLLTEVPPDLVLEGYALTPPGAEMSRGQLYAAVASRLDSVGPLRALACPHPATTAAVVGETTYVSTVLPWTSADGEHWPGESFSDRTVRCLETLRPFLADQLRLVWGGDWNHTLEGSLLGQTRAGRDLLGEILDELRLVAPTRSQPRGTLAMCSIDHVAVRGPVLGVEHQSASAGGRRLSDHDLYVVTV